MMARLLSRMEDRILRPCQSDGMDVRVPTSFRCMEYRFLICIGWE